MVIREAAPAETQATEAFRALQAFVQAPNSINRARFLELFEARQNDPQFMRRLDSLRDADRALSSSWRSFRESNPGGAMAAFLDSIQLRSGIPQRAESPAHLPTEARLNELIQQLDHPAFFTRRQAVRELGRIGSVRAVHGLIKRLSDEELIRADVAWALGRIGDPSAVPALTRLMRDESESVRRAAAESLGIIGDRRGVPALIKGLSDADQRVRRMSAWALGMIGDAQAVRSLSPLMDDNDPQMRYTVAEALGRIRDPHAADALIKRINDPDGRVRWHVIEALGRIGDARAVPSLIRASASDRQIQVLAFEALGAIADPAALGPIVKGSTHPDASVRRAATWALGRLGTSEMLPGLVSRLSDEDSGVRHIAVRGIFEFLGAAQGERMEVPGMLHGLSGLLRDSEPQTRILAARALGLLGNRGALGPLVQAVGDENPDVRSAAVGALGAIGDRESLPALRRIAENDPDDKVRDAARAAAGRIEGA